MSTPFNEPLDAPPYPSAGDRAADAAHAAGTSDSDADYASTADAEHATGAVDADRPEYAAERPDYSVDQVGDDQAPLDTVTEPVAYPADVEPAADTRPAADPAAQPVANTAPVASEATTTDEPLVPTAEGVDFKARWDVIQQGFVDDPRTAVTDADKLVADVLDRLSTTFDEQHRGLEGQWSDGEPSTEDLRSALQKYRAFFQRLLTI